MAFATVILGIGCGSYGSVYAYVVMASKVEERCIAISIRACVISVAVMLGPILQTAFVPIGLRGFVAANFHLDMYTATGWANVVIGIITVIVMATLFKEYWVAVDKSQMAKVEGDKMAEDTRVMRPFSKLSAAASIWISFVYLFFLLYHETIASPFSMLMFNWTAKEAVLYNGIIHIGMSVIDIWGNLIMGYIVLRYFEERKTMVVGLGSGMIGFLIMFCWPNLPDLIPASEVSWDAVTTTLASMTSNSTLLPCDFTWCSYTTRISFAQYLIGRVFVTLSVSIGFTPTATLFSKTIGPRKQGTYQGIFTAVGQGATTIAPLVSTFVYEYAGPRVAYSIMIAAVLSAMTVLAVCYKRMVPWKDWDD